MSGGSAVSAAEYARRFSFSERIYLVAEKCKGAFCIQIVFEGESRASSKEWGAAEDRLRKAVGQAADKNPGSRLVLKGVLGWTRWVANGPAPTVRVLERWPRGEEPPAELERRLCPYDGPTCEVVLTKPPSPRVVFRCFHGVMDARGLMHFAEEVFRAMRGEPLRGTNNTLSDTEFVTAQQGSRKREPLQDAYGAIGASGSVDERSVHWRRYTVGGSMTGLVAKVSSVLARSADIGSDERIRIMVPVDLRNYDKTVLSTANLSCPLFVDVAPDEEWKSVHKRILKGLIRKEPLRLDPNENLAPWLPLWLLRAAYAWRTGRQRRRRMFPMTSLVTHVALKTAELPQDEALCLEGCFFMPPQSDVLPLCVSAVSLGETTELVLSAPKYLMDEATLERLGEAMVTALGQSGAGKP